MKNIVGIIVEYNPFHYGHLHHLEETKKKTNADLVIAVMSGHFTQRGEPAIINKWQRTQIALQYGVDLVIELPFVYACNGADYFAAGAMSILNALQVNHLCFGSEQNNIDELNEIAKTIITHQEKYNELVLNFMKEGTRYPDACNLAIGSLLNKDVRTPNDILGLTYIKEIIKHQYPITSHSILRTNSFHEKIATSHIASATSIRLALENKQEIKDFVPDKACIDQFDQFFFNEYFDLLKYKLLTTSKDELQQLCFVSEGIESLFLKHITTSYHMDEFIAKMTSKRYTKTRIQRTIIHILLNHKKETPILPIPYLRVLGMNEKGQRYLKEKKKDINIPIVTNFSKDNHPYLDLEYKATCLYASIKKEPNKTNLIESEYKSHPIIYKDA